MPYGGDGLGLRAIQDEHVTGLHPTNAHPVSTPLSKNLRSDVIKRRTRTHVTSKSLSKKEQIWEALNFFSIGERAHRRPQKSHKHARAHKNSSATESRFGCSDSWPPTITRRERARMTVTSHMAAPSAAGTHQLRPVSAKHAA